MKYSYRQAIHELSDQSICCPACGRKNFYTTEKQKPHKHNGLPLLDGGKPVMETYDSYHCIDCGQRWTMAIELIWCTRVEYTENVGDKLRPNATPADML